MKNNIIQVKDIVESLKKMPQDAYVVSSSDDEGNNYSYVRYTPTKGKFNDDGGRGDFIDDGTLKIDGDKEGDWDGAVDVVCIN